MTTAAETVHNAPLSGAELKKIILADFERLLANEGFLTDNAAFGRVGYEVVLRLHLDNPLLPNTESHIVSKPAGRNLLHLTPELGALEGSPLVNPSPDAMAGASAIRREIISPNEERLRNNMAVPVLVRQQDGTTTQEFVKYPPDQVDGEGNVSITDQTAEARAAWGLPPAATEAPPSTRDNNPGDALCYCGYDKNSHALSGLCTQPPKEGFPKCEGFELASQHRPQEQKEAWPVTPS